MAHETEAVIGLGANLGNPEEALGEALRRLDKVPGVRVERVSSLYRTAPIDATGPDYTNAAAVLAVTIPAKDLLHAMQKIELDLGRVRPAGVHNAPRTIDLDIELFGDSPIDEPPELVVPHPRMHERRFVLEPLHEIRPDAVIPGLGPAVRFLTLVQDFGIQRRKEMRLEDLFFAGLLVLLVLIAAGFVKLCQKYREH